MTYYVLFSLGYGTGYDDAVAPPSADFFTTFFSSFFDIA